MHSTHDPPAEALRRSPGDAPDAKPPRIELATDRTSAGEALRLMRDHVHLVYRGDERNARQLFAALRAARR